MNKLNKKRVEQLQSGKVVLYTGDKKGSEEVKALLREMPNEMDNDPIYNFYGTDEHGDFNLLFELEIKDRPIHPIEWFYEEEETEKGIALKWYLKGFHDAETTESQPVSIEQTMKDAETHFYLQYNK